MVATRRLHHSGEQSIRTPTVITITNVGFQGCYPEAHLVIEEEVDLVWKKVPMVHWVSGGLYGGWIALVSRPG